MGKYHKGSIMHEISHSSEISSLIRKLKSKTKLYPEDTDENINIINAINKLTELKSKYNCPSYLIANDVFICNIFNDMLKQYNKII